MIRPLRSPLALLAAVVLTHSPVLAQAPAAQPAAAAAPVPPTLQKIRDRGVIVLAHRESSVPFLTLMQTSARSATHWICAGS